MSTILDPDLAAIATFVSGKPRSFIGRVREEKRAEIRALQASIDARRGLPDGDNYPLRRDARRICELRREVEYLSNLFDPQPDHPPPEAA